MSLDLQKINSLLDELQTVEERIADRGPILVLPRRGAALPNVPALKKRMEEIFGQLHVRRNYTVAKGHDLDGNRQPFGYDLTSVGIVSAVRSIATGKDRALPSSSTIVQVGFPGGENLWFDPNDLEPAP